MSKERMDSFRQFANNIEYPMVTFEADTGRVVYMNYEAEVVLGKEVECLRVEAGRTRVKKDFWESVHSR